MVDLRIIVFAPAMIMLLMAMLPVMNIFNEQLFDKLDESDDTSLPNLIKVLMGGIPFIIALGIGWAAWRGTQSQTPQIPSDF